MFHVEQFFAAAASLIWVAAAAEPCNPIILATESETAALECNLGLQDTLLGERESAAQHFRNSLAADETCALAHCGLILLERNAPDYAQRLDKLQQLIATYPATPAEALFINSLLKLACNEVNGAAADFQKQAEQHRNDVSAACWAISLLQLCNKTDDARELADTFLRMHSGEPMLLYLRAAVEETADEVSDTALQCAQIAAILMRNTAPAELLYAKLLAKRGLLAQSCIHFHMARKLAKQDMQAIGGKATYTYLNAGLGEATSLLSAGRTEEARQLRRAMNAETLPGCSEDAAILRQWETSTLPLRSLIFEPKPTRATIQSAVQTAKAAKGDDVFQEYVKCLAESLNARNASNKFETESRIANAKLCLKHIEDAPRRYDLQAVVLQRAKYACRVAIAAAQTQLYGDTHGNWYDMIEPGQDAIGRLLPPVVPPRAIVPRGTK